MTSNLREPRLLREHFRTRRARVGFDARVCAFVLRETRLLGRVVSAATPTAGGETETPMRGAITNFLDKSLLAGRTLERSGYRILRSILHPLSGGRKAFRPETSELIPAS